MVGVVAVCVTTKVNIDNPLKTHCVTLCIRDVRPVNSFTPATILIFQSWKPIIMLILTWCPIIKSQVFSPKSPVSYMKVLPFWSPAFFPQIQNGNLYLTCIPRVWSWILPTSQVQQFNSRISCNKNISENCPVRRYYGKVRNRIFWKLWRGFVGKYEGGSVQFPVFSFQKTVFSGQC